MEFLKKMSRAEQVVLSIFILIFLFSGVSLFFTPKKNSNDVPVSTVLPNPFDAVVLTAKSAYVYDIAENKVLYELNKQAELPLASLAKVMTALTAEELVPHDVTVTIDRDSLLEEGDTGLFAEEAWSLKTLLHYLLVVSSNDGAHAVAQTIGALEQERESTTTPRQVFVRKMNELAQKIGLNNSYFINESGLDENVYTGGAYGTAEDIARLFSYTITRHPSLLEPTRHREMLVTSKSAITHTALNTNTAIAAIPGILASKTGFSDLAGGNLAIAFDASMMRPIVVVVLGSTQEGRFEDVLALTQAAREYIQNEEIIN
jgi:D-alanyl-D-alanine carboxypeptidase